MSDKLPIGQLVLIGLSGGVNVMGVLQGMTKDRFLSTEERWIEIDHATSYTTQLGHLQQGQAAIMATAIPWGASPDVDVSIRVQVSNILTVCFFEDMPKEMASMLRAKMSDSERMASRIRSSNSGLTI